MSPGPNSPQNNMEQTTQHRKTRKASPEYIGYWSGKNCHCLPINRLLSISIISTVQTQTECSELPESKPYKLQEKLQEKPLFSDRPSTGTLRFEAYKFYLPPTTVFKHSIRNLPHKHPSTCSCFGPLSLEGFILCKSNHSNHSIPKVSCIFIFSLRAMSLGWFGSYEPHLVEFHHWVILGLSSKTGRWLLLHLPKIFAWAYTSGTSIWRPSLHNCNNHSLTFSSRTLLTKQLTWQYISFHIPDC